MCCLPAAPRLWAETPAQRPTASPALTIRSGGGVLRMKHLIWPFSPWRACWVWVLEMMGGPVGETASRQDFRSPGVGVGHGLRLRSLLIISVTQRTFPEGLCGQGEVQGVSREPLRGL